MQKADDFKPDIGLDRGVETISILLVDDESRNLDALESILVAPGRRLVRALRPEDALLALLHGEFACIVLDIQMPGMSGFELARQIKTRKRNQHTPIIFLTAFYLDEKDVVLGYGTGAVDYLTKPVSPEILKSKVGVFVDLYRTTRALATANAALEHEAAHRRGVEEALRIANGELEISGQRARLQLAAIVESTDDAIIARDTQGVITSWNKGAERLYGYNAAEIVGKQGSVLMPPERIGEETEMLARIHGREGFLNYETVRLRKDGSWVEVSLTVSPLKDASGKVVGTSKIARDITGRRRAERQQHALFELVSTVNRASSLADVCEAALQAIVFCQRADRASILLCDAQGTMCFKAWHGLSENYRHAVQRHSPWKKGESPRPVFITDISCAEMDEGLKKTVDSEGIRALAFIPILFENNLLGKFMIYYDAPHSFSTEELQPIETIASQVAFAVERERALRELKQAHEELLVASRAKDDFLATLSHEMRTPLNPVLLLASDAVNNRDLPPRVRADFNTIRKNIELEARLIDDLLDLTRIARGKITLDKHVINIRRVLRDAITQVREDMEHKQISLELEFNAAQHVVFADAVRLQQIFWNLFKNAVKFTPEGGRITVETASSKEKLLVKVADTGIGMTPGELGGIFNAFVQGEHSGNGKTQRFGGLGLGLAIAQRLAELHSGRIHAASDGPHEGSTFTLELPLASSSQIDKTEIAPETPADAARGPVHHRFAILLVEDHEPTRSALAVLLIRRHHQVATAATAAEALALAGSRDFDLLISDIGLPDGNGYDLMSKLRKRGNLRGIALTGYGMDHDVTRSQQAGFDAHLTKPVRIEALEAALNMAAGRKEADPLPLASDTA